MEPTYDRLLIEACDLERRDPVAGARLRELMPKGFNAYPWTDLAACIHRARTHAAVQRMNLPPVTADQLFGPSNV